MRCKAKHTCYITKDGERTFRTLLIGFFKLKNEFYGIEEKK